MTEPTFEEPVGEATEAARRGRPRSRETLARDEAVVQALGDGVPKTREQLAEQLSEPSSLVYLALWRLARAGKVEKTNDGAVRHAWRLTG